ncbi:MAG: trigger factor [Gammaproteobacteria bacterium]
MQVSVETTQGLERRMKVQVPAERVEREVEQRLRDLGKRARLNGFRPGKIPFSVVKKRFGNGVRQEVVGDLLRDTCNEALSQEKLNPAGGPRIDTVNSEPGKDLEYTATFEVYPDIALQGSEGVAIERLVAEVTPADLDAMLDNLRHQRARWESVARAAREGDRVQLDFEGRIAGAEFPGNKGDNVPVTLGAGRMLPDFETNLKDVSAGEQREFDVRFPDDYQAKDVAGKTAHFKVTVHQVEAQILPELDADFCRSFGIENGSLEQLRAEVTENMRHEMAETVRQRMKDQLLTAVLAANPVTVPKSLVDQDIEHLRHDAEARMGVRDARKSVDLPRELFAADAERRVSLGLIIGELIKQLKLEVDERRVDERLERLASDYTNPGEAQRSLRANVAVMRQLETLVLEDQVVDALLAKAVLTDKPTSFKELMHFGEHKHDHSHAQS